jgi:hypothetical protein
VILNEVVPWITNNSQPWYHMSQPPQTLAIILLSLGAFTYARHPEGILEYNKRRSLDFIQRRITRDDAHSDDSEVDQSRQTSPETVPVTGS